MFGYFEVSWWRFCSLFIQELVPSYVQVHCSCASSPRRESEKKAKTCVVFSYVFLLFCSPILSDTCSKCNYLVMSTKME